jgi:uncharacterized protein YndB with AHSA1/START domain
MMAERSVVHDTFVIERSLGASPKTVFDAFADPAKKAQWFGAPDNGDAVLDLDFTVGGREFNSGGEPGGAVYTYEAVYRDIVENERIVTTYEMSMDGARISVSLASTEFLPEGEGTKLIYTEQGAYLDGLDVPRAREHGTNELFDALSRYLENS